MEPKITTPIVKGLIISLILIVLTLAITFTNQQFNKAFQWLGYLIFFAGIILSVWQYGKQIDHQSTFGNYFAHGFKVGAVVTCIMVVFIILFIFLFPEFKEKALEEMKRGMQNKSLSEEQADKYMEGMRKYFMVISTGGTLLVYMLFSAIAALIGAAITKKNPNTFQQDINQIGG
ncbi:MAG: DUF4199 family protein [Ginsengibacter sp.]